MNIKKIIAIILIIAIQQISFCCIADAEELEIVKSYYLLKYEYNEFLVPLIYSGATEPEMIAFFSDIEVQLQKIDGITEQNFEKNLKNVLLDVATYRKHRNVSSIFLQCYEKEITEYMETNVIPQRLTGVYNALMKILFGTEADSKVELASIYEKYKNEYDAGLSAYTETSVQAFKQSLDKTLNILKNTAATLEEIADAKTDLVSTYSNLQRKPTVIPGGTGTGGGTSSGAGGASGSGGGASGGGASVSGETTGSANTNPELLLFNDLTNKHWSYTAVKYLVEKSVINGFEDKTFRPENLVTREEFSKMLSVALNLSSAETYTDYIDVEKGSWYDDYVQRITASKIMKGTGNNMFGTGETLTRQDLAVIAFRLIQNGIISNNYTVSDEYTPFSDLATASDYAQEAIDTMKKYNIINGIGNNLYAPHDGVTRAQAAQIIYSLVK